jgi:hypothetical protein
MLNVAAENKLVNCSRLLFWVVVLNILTALNTMSFWIGFFTEITFPIEELKPLIHNFEGYYAWERCFVVPDTLLAIATLTAGIRLLRNQGDMQALFILGASAGAWIFLGVLDFTYGISNGMYTLGHSFSYTLLSIGIGLPIIGSFTLWSLNKVIKENLK